MPAGDKKTSDFNAISVLASGDKFTALDVSEGELRTVTGTAVLTWLGASLDMSTIASGGALPVAYGGTGRATGTTAYALIAVGTTATGAQQTLGVGATTQILVGGGASALPVWTTATGTGAPVRATSPTFVTSIFLGGSATAALSRSFNIESTTPAFNLYETDAPVDEKGWDFFASAGDLFFRTYNDALSVAVNWLKVTRTGTTIDQIVFQYGYMAVGISAATALLHLGASTTARASLCIPSGTAPTSPVTGDMWFDGTNLKFRISGSTKTITWT